MATIGSITRTSGTGMYDRIVRVDRRFRNRDHVGGTYASFQTIIQRYHIRLFPDAHQRREREHTGEILAKPEAFRATADPTHNGKSIMIGDRFIDEKNNNCYDVVSAIRPRGQSPYSQTMTFELRIVEDCPQLRQVGYPGVPANAGAVAGASGGGGGPTQSHFILRSFGQNEILAWDTYPYYDGFVYDLQNDDPVTLAALSAAVASGKQWFRYYNVQVYPYSASELGGTTPPLTVWFNWLRDNIQFLATVSHRRMRVGSQVSLFPGSASPMGQSRELIPWVTLTAGERQAAVAEMIALSQAPGGLALPAQGIFMDQAWLKVESFQVDGNLAAESGHGNAQESGPPIPPLGALTALDFAGTDAAFGDGGTWATTTTAMMALYSEIATGLAAVSGYAIKNGEHRTQNGETIPKPWYFENAWNNNVDGATQPDRWAFAKAEFATDQRNVLSILCSAAPNETIGVPEALDHWETTGGWIAFTNQGVAGEPNQELAYAAAAARLAQIGFPQ